MDATREPERRLIADSPALNVKENENGRTVIRGYAALYNSDSQPLGPRDKKFIERIKPGAFDAVVAANPDVFARYNHERLLGRTISGTCRLFLDERGLGYEIDPKPADADVVQSLARGDVRGSSFMFFSAEGSSRWYRDEKGQRIREIRSVDWLGDVGPVDSPAYLDTEAYVSARALAEGAKELGEPELAAAEEAEVRENADLPAEEIPEVQETVAEPVEPVAEDRCSEETVTDVDYFGRACDLSAAILKSRLHGR